MNGYPSSQPFNADTIDEKQRLPQSFNPDINFTSAIISPLRLISLLTLMLSLKMLSYLTLLFTGANHFYADYMSLLVCMFLNVFPAELRVCHMLLIRFESRLGCSYLFVPTGLDSFGCEPCSWRSTRMLLLIDVRNGGIAAQNQTLFVSSRAHCWILWTFSDGDTRNCDSSAHTALMPRVVCVVP
jgi:hypothetical protein